jgi:putative transposase
VWCSAGLTTLRGPVKDQFYYLHAILDVFRRYVAGWLIAERESAGLAEETIFPTD